MLNKCNLQDQTIQKGGGVLTHASWIWFLCLQMAASTEQGHISRREQESPSAASVCRKACDSSDRFVLAGLLLGLCNHVLPALWAQICTWLSQKKSDLSTSRMFTGTEFRIQFLSLKAHLSQKLWEWCPGQPTDLPAHVFYTQIAEHFPKFWSHSPSQKCEWRQVKPIFTSWALSLLFSKLYQPLHLRGAHCRKMSPHFVWPVPSEGEACLQERTLVSYH